MSSLRDFGLNGGVEEAGVVAEKPTLNLEP